MKHTISFLTISIFLLTGAIGVQAATPKAIDQEIVDGESGVYILYDDGFLHTAGETVNLGYPEEIQAVDFTLTPSQKGYYILEEDGTVHSFGDALIIHQSLSDTNRFVDMEYDSSEEGFYFLKEDGSVQPAGDAVFYGDSIRENAVDLEIGMDGKGYYVLYQDGSIAFFGTAVNLGFTQSSRKKAVDLELAEGGYYVLFADGTLEHFGDVVPLPTPEGLPEDAIDMTLTERGYRILSTNGEDTTILHLKNQGTISWYAQAVPRDVKPQATATPTPTLTPTPTPRAGTKYFDLKLADFSEKVIGRLPEGAMLPPNLTTSQASVPNGDTFVLVATGEEQKAKRIRLYKAVNFESAENEGILFADLVPERGAASVRGITYSDLGLVVTLYDEPRPILLLIEGPFEPASAKGYRIQ